MNRRPTIKGRGADVYLDSANEPKPQPTEPRRMVTTYLPAHLVDRLHQVWLSRMQKDPKAQKAHIITEALEQFFKGLDG